METTFSFKNLEKNEERQFADYIGKKLPAISELLTTFAADAKLLKVVCEKFDKHQAYQVDFCLVLPNKTIFANETSHAMTKAVDLAKDRVLPQIKKHLDHLRKERSQRSIRDHKEETVAIEQLEEIAI